MTKAVEDDDQVENTTSSWYKVQLREEVGSFSSLFKQAKPDEDEIKDFFFCKQLQPREQTAKFGSGDCQAEQLNVNEQNWVTGQGLAMMAKNTLGRREQLNRRQEDDGISCSEKSKMVGAGCE